MAAAGYDSEASTDDVYSSPSSGCSSMAPTDFKLSQSFDGSCQAGVIVSVALERCLLCYGSRRSFYCKYCVRSGEFVHSRTNQLPFQQPSADVDRYADKLKRWKSLKKDREKLVERFHSQLAKRTRITQKQTDVRLRKQRLLMMREELVRLSSSVTTGEKQLADLRTNVSTVEQRIAQYSQEHGRILMLVDKLTATIDRHRQYHQHTLDELMAIRQRHIRDLITFIFPITELPATSSCVENMSIMDATTTAAVAAGEESMLSMVSLLADACRMAHVKGRWVYTENGYEHLYRIVVPTLPGNGDYSMATIDTKDVTSQGAEVGSTLEYSQTQHILAALSLTSQLVSLLAYYLDVILPRQLKFSEFFSSELTEQAFSRAVQRLNHNILRLFFTQSRIDIAGVDPRNTIINLLAVLNSPQLGSAEANQIIDDDETAALMRSIESSLLGLPPPGSDSIQLATASSDSEQSDSEDRFDVVSGSGDGATGTSCDDRPTGWEHVPITLPEVEASSISGRSSLPSYLVESSTAVTSIVSSLWRWGRGASD